MEPFKPRKFGQFFLLNKIAQGGMAEIFCAVEIDDRTKKIALKKLLPRYSDDRRFISMLIDEAKITCLLEHPNIVKVFDVGSVGMDFYISFEYIHGKSLDLILKRLSNKDSRLKPFVAAYMIGEISKALEYGHNFKDSQGRDLHIIHRDVTPGNILVGYDGGIKLADFGIAIVKKDSSLAKEEPAFGKKFYMPPEQFKNLQVEKTADIYSLGVLAYEMLTGRKVFDATNEIELQDKILNEYPIPPSRIDPSLKEVDEPILKALQKEPKKRFASAKEFFCAISKAFPAAEGSREELLRMMDNIFGNDRSLEERTMEGSLASIETETGEAQKEEEAQESQESTQMITKDYEEMQTSFIPKDAKRNEEAPKVRAPVIKIKTKKITQEELFEIRKQEARQELFDPELNPDATMLKTKGGKEEETESPVIPEMIPERPNQSELKFEEPPFELSESKAPRSEESLPFEPPKKEISKPAEPIPDIRPAYQKEKGMIRMFMRSVPVIAAAVVVLIFLVSILTRKDTRPAISMSPATPVNISVVFFSDDPPEDEKRAFEKLLSKKPDKRFDSIYSLKRFFQKEYTRTCGMNLDFVKFDFIGPVIVDKEPPQKPGLFSSKNIHSYFASTATDKKLNLKATDIKIYVFFYNTTPEEPPKYPLIYRGYIPKGEQIVFLPLLRDSLNSSIILLANRILAVFGATEKTDSQGNPLFPEGFANPKRNPLYPQEHGEIMVRYIPEGPSALKPPRSIEDMRIGPKTAWEIGWIKEEEYRKLMGN